MKTIKILSIAIIAVCFANFSFGQEVKESFKVSGECGMCKKKIEKSAKDAGASYALWDQKTKTLTVKYNSTSSNAAKIQKKIAETGYDTPEFKATEESYQKLDACCQYDRTSASPATEEKKMDCCKDGKCSKEGHDGKDCCKKS